MRSASSIHKNHSISKMFLHMVLNISTTVRKITNGDQSCENWKIKKLEDDLNKKKGDSWLQSPNKNMEKKESI